MTTPDLITTAFFAVGTVGLVYGARAAIRGFVLLGKRLACDACWVEAESGRKLSSEHHDCGGHGGA